MQDDSFSEDDGSKEGSTCEGDAQGTVQTSWGTVRTVRFVANHVTKGKWAHDEGQTRQIQLGLYAAEGYVHEGSVYAHTEGYVYAESAQRTAGITSLGVEIHVYSEIDFEIRVYDADVTVSTQRAARITPVDFEDRQ